MQIFFAMESGIFGLWLSPDETCLGMYDCVLLVSWYWTMWWRRNTERVRTVSLSRFTSVLAMVFCLVVGVGFVFGLCFLGLVVCLCCCVMSFAGAVEECYVLCWDDCTFRSPGANQGGVSQWRAEQANERAPTKGGPCPVRGSLC